MFGLWRKRKQKDLAPTVIIDPPKPLPSLEEITSTALLNASLSFETTVCIDPIMRAKVEEIAFRLNCPISEVFCLGIESLMEITEGNNRDFVVTRFGKLHRLRVHTTGDQNGSI